MFLHCIIHQQALCAKYVDISCVLDPVTKMVNLIRSHGLNHRQFREMLRETEIESVDMPYYTAVRWLSCGKVLSRVCKLAFAADITGHINSLNLKLQGEENLISDFLRI